MSKIRVLIADYQPVFREGLAGLISSEPDMELVATTGDSEEAVRMSREIHPDVAVIADCIPKFSGLEAAKNIKATSPKTAILMVSNFDDESHLYDSLRAGVAGYMLNTSPGTEFINAIRMIHNGDAVFNLPLIIKFLSRISVYSADRTNRNSPNVLREREAEVIRLAAKGITNRMIGKQLGISERTVQSHMMNAFRKLNVNSRTEAVVRAMRDGLITSDDLGD